MPSIFISYRRDDAAGHAGRLSDRLVARFGSTRVFMDVDDITPGENFEDAINRTLSRCDHVLVVIGPRWLDLLQAPRAAGQDYVRHEIVAAMALGRTVVPVLVGGAKMPAAETLPAELAAFSRCNAIEIRDDRFGEDAADLLAFLAGGRGRRWIIAGIVGGAVALAAAAVGYRSSAPAPPSAPIPSIDGTWLAEMQKPAQRPYNVRFAWVRDGDRLTGTVSYPTGDAAILDGHYGDGHFTFRTEHVPQFASEPAVIRTEGRFDGVVVTLTMADLSGTATGNARRVTAAR